MQIYLYGGKVLINILLFYFNQIFIIFSYLFDITSYTYHQRITSQEAFW